MVYTASNVSCSFPNNLRVVTTNRRTTVGRMVIIRNLGVPGGNTSWPDRRKISNTTTIDVLANMVKRILLRYTISVVLKNALFSMGLSDPCEFRIPFQGWKRGSGWGVDCRTKVVVKFRNADKICWLWIPSEWGGHI